MRRTALLLILSMAIVPFTATVPVQAQSYDDLKTAIGNIPAGGTGTITLSLDITTADDDLTVGQRKTVNFVSTRPFRNFSGLNTYSIFHVLNGSTLVFQNRAENISDTISFGESYLKGSLDAENPLVFDGGGAFRVFGDLNDDDDDDDDDGEIRIAELRFFTKAQFQDNHVEADNNYGGYGGAFLTSSAIVEFLGETVDFTNNTAEKAGGAIAARDGSIFIFGDTMGQDGAAAVTTTVFGGLTIQGEIDPAKANIAETGGAIYALNDAAFMFNGPTAFYGNQATGGSGGAIATAFEVGPNGGAIHGVPGIYFQDEVVFRENTASENGGAISLEGGLFDMYAHAEFLANEATIGSGGAIYVSDGGNLRIAHSAQFSQNQADSYGGAIYVAGTASSVFLSPNAGDVVFGSLDGTLANMAGGKANSVTLGDGGTLYLEPTVGLVNGQSVSHAVRFYDPISGDAGTVVKLGQGNALFWGENLFTGTTIINAGRFVLVGDVLGRDGSLLTPGAVYGDANLRKGFISISGDGVLQISDGNTVYAQSMTLSGGRVFVTGGTNGGLEQVKVSKNTARLDIPIINLTADEGQTRPGGVFHIDTDVVFTLESRLTGAGQLFKEGLGILTLRNTDNDFTGATVVSQGMLQAFNNGMIRSNGVLKGTQCLFLQGGSVFNLNDTDQRIGGLIGEAGTQVWMETEEMRQGWLTLNGNPVAYTSENPANVLTVFPGYTGPPAFTDSEGRYDFRGTILGNGMLEKRGDGALVLSAENTFTGGTVLERGQILLGNKNALVRYAGTSAGVIIARESYGLQDSQADPYKEIGIDTTHTKATDMALQNRFVVLTPTAAQIQYNTLTLEASGKLLTISGNESEANIALRLPGLSQDTILTPDGGAFHVQSRGVLVFSDVDPDSRYRIENNRVTGRGGAFFVGDGGDFLLNTTGMPLVISQNSANTGGGIHVAQNGTITIHGGTSVLANRAQSNGGGLYLAGGRNADNSAESLILADDPDKTILFEGNIAGAGTTYRYNSIYLNAFNTLTFQADKVTVIDDDDDDNGDDDGDDDNGNGNGEIRICEIRIFDPIESRDGDSGNLIVKTGEGDLLLRGKYREGYGYFGDTTISAGRMVLESTDVDNVSEYGGINTGAVNTFLLDTQGTLTGWGLVRASDFQLRGTMDVATGMTLEGQTATLDATTLTGSGTLGVFLENDATATIKNSVLGNIALNSTLVLDAKLEGEGNLVKRGGGTLVLADNVTLIPNFSTPATGALTIHGGKLTVGIGGRSTRFQADSATVAAGATFQVADRAEVRLRSLKAQPLSTLSLAVNNSANPTVLVDEYAEIASATLDITGFDGRFEPEDMDQTKYVLIRSGLGFIGDFKPITLGGNAIDIDSFLTLAVKIENNLELGTVDYVAKAGLAWYAGTDVAHGTFNVATEFNLSTPLHDVASTGPWNGRSLTKTGEGTLTLSGTNTYTGGTTVLGGTLAGNEKSLQGAIELDHGTTLLFNDTTNGTFNGTITGAGSVINAGRLRLEGRQSYGGSTTVAGGGLLSVAGIVQYSAFRVQENGALFVDGTIKSATVEAGGLFGAGDVGKVGTAKLGDTLLMNAGSTLRVHIGTDGVGDRINVTKTADISGVTLDVAGTENTTAEDYTANQYTVDFLSATGGLKGTMFEAITTDLAFANYNSDVFTTGQTATLVLVNKDFRFRNYSSGWTQNRMAETFDRIVETGTYYPEFSPLFSRLRSLDREDMGAAMQQVAGTAKANALMLGQWDVARPTLERLDLENIDDKRIRGTLNHFWIETFYQGTDARGDNNSVGYGIERPGFILGVDRRWTTTTVVGMTFGYSRPILKSEGDEVSAHDFQAGLYIGQILPLGSELKGYFGFGGQGYESSRWLRHSALVGDTPRELRGSYQGDSFDMTVELSRPFRWGPYVNFRPIAAWDLMLTTHGGHTERGDALLGGDYDRVHYGRGLSRFGARIKYENHYASLWFQMFYAIKCVGEDSPETKFRFVSTPGDRKTTVRGVDPGGSYLYLGAGGHFDLNKRKTRKLFYTYDLTVAGHMTTNTGSLGFLQQF